jgi:hypothetical protein
LVSTINGDGHPVFFWDPTIQPQEDPTKSFQHSLLKYIVALLVHKNEIVAAVAHKPKVSTNAQTAYQVNIVGAKRSVAPLPRGLASGTGQNDQGESARAAFTAVANPHNVKSPREEQRGSRKPLEKDPYFDHVSDGVDYLVLTGESHILDRDSEDTTLWARILKIW